MKKKAVVVAAPIIKFRSLLFGIIIVAVVISGPLLLVYKQVYITSTSKTIEKTNDSLLQNNRMLAELQLRCERLASNDRIERIARKSLDLEYPGAEQIVIVKVPRSERILSRTWPQDLAAFIKRSLFGEPVDEPI
jgi:cell division protein FtsL